MIREAKEEDVDVLVTLHVNNMNKNELSMLLGVDVIREFYLYSIRDPHATVMILEDSNFVVAVSIIYTRYDLFTKKFKKMLVRYFLLNFYRYIRNYKNLLVILRKFWMGDLSKKVPHHIYNFHVGLFILDKKARENCQLVVEFVQMYRDNVKKLQQYSSNYWGSCYCSNSASKRLMEDQGMSFFIRSPSYPEDIYIGICDVFK
ncbi:MAG TPA: hypothetical protein DEG23_01790 [Coxiellaceae bacterium]|nr:hypothetical protein [Coxiellaceae bacterium]